MTAEERIRGKRAIDRHVRAELERCSRRGPRILETHEEWVIEVDSAMLAYHRDGPWPPDVHVPPGAIGALVGT